MTFESINVADNLICPVLEDESGPARENMKLFIKEVMATKIHDKKTWL